MVKRLVTCPLILFFAILFCSCNSAKYTGPQDEGGRVVDFNNTHDIRYINVDSKWAELPEGEPFPWESRDGFFPNKDNPYGFDKHTKPGIGIKEDSIVYVSIAHNKSMLVTLEDEEVGQHGKDGYVNLKINQIGGLPSEYEYYICDPEYKDVVKESIDNSKLEQTYKFPDKDVGEEEKLENYVKKIALCRKDKYGGVAIVQELHKYIYYWKNYNFFPMYYTSGNGEYSALILSREFWKGSREVYKQALVSPAPAESALLLLGYDRAILTRVRGGYAKEDGCSPSLFETIHAEVLKAKKDDINFPNRAILQLGLPTRRYWALKEDANGNIALCGNPEERPRINDTYDIVPVEINCEVNASVKTAHFKSDNRLYMKDKNGKSQLMTLKDLDKPKCAGIAERNVYTYGQQYVGEFNKNTLARTWIDKDNNIALIFLPWHGEDTKSIAYHELGHAMGLGDVYENVPGMTEDMQESEQGNNMFFLSENKMHKGYKLRQREVPIKDPDYLSPYRVPIGYENQWDCLQRESPEKSCAIQGWSF